MTTTDTKRRPITALLSTGALLLALSCFASSASANTSQTDATAHKDRAALPERVLTIDAHLGADGPLGNTGLNIGWRPASFLAIEGGLGTELSLFGDQESLEATAQIRLLAPVPINAHRGLELSLFAGVGYDNQHQDSDGSGFSIPLSLDSNTPPPIYKDLMTGHIGAGLTLQERSNLRLGIDVGLNSAWSAAQVQTSEDTFSNNVERLPESHLFFNIRVGWAF